MPLNGVMLMKQAGMAARRLRLPGKWLHCSALETLAWPHSHQCSSPAQGCPGIRRNLDLLSQTNGQGSSWEMKADQVLFHEH